MEKLDNLISDAVKEATGYDKFAISTLIPKKMLIKEEEGFDSELGESMKNSLNRKIIGKIIKASGMEYSPLDAEIRIIFNLNNYSYEIKNEPMFIFGRYMKYDNTLCQSRWACKKCNGRGCMHCDDKGKLYESIEENIGDPIKEMSKCSNYSLHASGREDVDVENLAGRPFVLELKDPKKREIDFKEINKIMKEGGKVEVKDWKVVGQGWVELVSNSHFDKTYEAEVEVEGKLELEKIMELEGKIIFQNTPKRVIHRRAKKIRKRKIKKLEIVKSNGNLLTIRITAEAGTYIKELIHGDEGRTKPSFSSVLGVKAECKKLKVVRIYDGFLDTI